MDCIVQITNDLIDETLKQYSLPGDDPYVISLKKLIPMAFYNPNETWRGPHQEIELELMLANKKPAAIISREEQIKKWNPHLETGRFIYKKLNDELLVVAQPNKVWRLNKIVELLRHTTLLIKKDKNRSKKEYLKYTIMLGLLLGYDKNDIKRFIHATA
jgi:hypothetical protein